MTKPTRRIPHWIKFKIPSGNRYNQVKNLLQNEKLHTVCTEAKCPNIGECLSKGTATFLILGNICTRNCRYCSISSGVPLPVDKKKSGGIARAVASLGLQFVVITSVTRDDLIDGGALHFALTVKAIRLLNKNCRVELLIPDFKNSLNKSLNTVMGSRPDIINHNIEVVNKFFRSLRPDGDYTLSLKLHELVSDSGFLSKSGLMIGFGETFKDIKSTLNDLFYAGCRIVTIGQYLQSTMSGFPVVKFYTPEEFSEIKNMAIDIGFHGVLSTPLVRSSYLAEKIMMDNKNA